MQLDSVLYQQDPANRPGRLGLTPETYYDSGAISLVSDTISHDLPQPAEGYIRRWEHVTAKPTVSGFGDVLYVERIAYGESIGVTLHCIYGVSMAGPYFPVIGSRGTGFSLTVAGPMVEFRGVEPFWISSNEVIRVKFVVTAPTSQTMVVRGFYRDEPI